MKERIHPMKEHISFTLAAAASGVLVLVILLMLASPFTQTSGGEYAVVRNGGWFDDRQVQQVIPPGQGMTPSGLWSTVHRYPSTQRNFVVSSSPQADTNEVIQVPSKDGVLLGIEGTFYFTLNGDPQVLTDFDNKFGTRTYPIKGDTALPSEGDEGWNAFLSFTLGNLVQNDLRREVVKYDCAQLVASCSLAQNNANPQAVKTDKDQILAIQQVVNTSIQTDIATTLGGAYFTGVQFVLAKVTLPGPVQDAVNNAQAAFAGVTSAQAGLQKAQIEAQANAVRQGGYTVCPTCADIDRLKALPPGITTYAPGAGVAVGGGAR